MSFYETLYIVDPNLENKALERTMNEIGKELEKTKSKIINHRLWGKKRLAYIIERQKYGSYIIMQFEGGDQTKMVDYDTWMKLNNAVLRHMTVSLNNKPEPYIEDGNSEIRTEPEESDSNKKNTDNDKPTDLNIEESEIKEQEIKTESKEVEK